MKDKKNPSKKPRRVVVKRSTRKGGRDVTPTGSIGPTVIVAEPSRECEGIPVDERPETFLEGLKLRGLIAFTARCVRRVFPIVILTTGEVRKYDEAIAMAEAFAAGEPGSLILARRVADEVKDDSTQPDGEYPHSLEQNSWYARHAVIEVAKASVSAFSAVTLIPPSKPCCQEAVEHAAIAYRHAERTTKPFVIYGERSDWDREAGWARNAIKRDLEAIRKSHRGSITELGLAINTSVHGPLGPLWSHEQVPKWYKQGIQKWRKPLGITMIEGEEFLRLLSSAPKPFPDLVYWYLESVTDEDELKKLTGSLEKMQQLSRRSSRPAPGLVVYAPGIAEDKRLELVRQGAIVYADALKHNAETFRAALHDHMEEVYDGWEKDTQGLWVYAGSRVTWRDGLPRPTPHLEERDEPWSAEETEESGKCNKVAPEHYQMLLEYLYANKQ